MQETISQRIKRYRKALNYTQQEVAEKMGLKLSTYSQMERSGKFDALKFAKLAEILKVDVYTLLLDENGLNHPDPIITPDITLGALTTRETQLITLYRAMSKPNQTLVYEFVYNFFREGDFKKVIKIMNPESF